MVSERGIEANPEKIEAIAGLQSPKTLKEVQKLTGSADRNLLFFKSLGKAKEFKWTEECEQALESLKHYLASPPLLANPKPGEVFFIYLAISEETVSSVLVKEREKSQNLVNYISKMLQGAEKRYTQIEKLALALVVTTRKLRPYLQSHKVVVLTNQPLRHIMTQPNASGRLLKWAIELGEYDIEYQGRTTVKAQVLADFIVEFTGEQVQEKNKGWLLHVDGSSNASNGGAGILLQGPNEVEIEVAARLLFAAINKEAEYETLILGLQLALEAGVRELSACTDSQLVAMQQIPHNENERADALSKFGAMVAEIKSRKVTIMIKEHSTIEQTKEAQVMEGGISWKNDLIRYLKETILPNDLIQETMIRFKATRFTM
ncbi:UNVERIFIED_CONTAM: hypothetical protein Sradi_3206200 [Sesamum radiatum]|uniref:RNase H type-1 domain-containing protein n=1 Tax=Sesamum radiatum TaxID=300843 RepID=A0AAW2RFU6_SESRA